MFGDCLYIFIVYEVCFIISSLVILYSDDYMFGDLNIVRFISLVLLFVVSNISDFRLSWFYSVQCQGSTSDKGMAAVFLVLSNYFLVGLAFEGCGSKY